MNPDRLIYCPQHGGWRHSLSGQCSRCVHDRLAAELFQLRNASRQATNRRIKTANAARCRSAKAMYPTYTLRQLAAVVGLSHETVRKALKSEPTP